jgi:hypothetical protein
VTRDANKTHQIATHIGIAIGYPDAEDLPEGEASGYVLAGIIK